MTSQPSRRPAPRHPGARRPRDPRHQAAQHRLAAGAGAGLGAGLAAWGWAVPGLTLPTEVATTTLPLPPLTAALAAGALLAAVALLLVAHHAEHPTTRTRATRTTRVRRPNVRNPGRPPAVRRHYGFPATVEPCPRDARAGADVVVPPADTAACLAARCADGVLAAADSGAWRRG